MRKKEAGVVAGAVASLSLLLLLAVASPSPVVPSKPKEKETPKEPPSPSPRTDAVSGGVVSQVFAREEAFRTYQAFCDARWGNDIGAAHALSVYHRYGGKDRTVISNYQRALGRVKVTGTWDADTEARVSALTTL